MITVIVPAHNESQVIGRLLRQMVIPAKPGELDVIVIANGCTDNTAEIAASYGPDVRVITLRHASKSAALAAGNEAATGFPRIYLDADVEVSTATVRRLAAALREPGILAAAPERALSLAACPRLVRWYLTIWLRLPQVRCGLFARGVIAVNAAGYQRLAGLPPLMADDLAASLSFAPHERMIVPGACAVAHPPRRFADLLRRRIRAAQTVSQFERVEHAPAVSAARTRMSDLLGILRREPWLAPQAALFLAVAVLARARARPAVARNDYSSWLRDDSSRRPAPSPAGHGATAQARPSRITPRT